MYIYIHKVIVKFGINNNISGLSLTLSRLPPDYNFCVQSCSKPITYLIGCDLNSSEKIHNFSN